MPHYKYKHIDTTHEPSMEVNIVILKNLPVIIEH